MLYRYDEVTKEYLWGMAACLDPLESERQGRPVFTKPPFCTDIPAPDVKEHEAAVFNEELNTWEIKEDFRGASGFNKKTGEAVFITELGELPENFVTEKPVSLQDVKDYKLIKLAVIADEERRKEVEYLGMKGNLDLRITLQTEIAALGDLNVFTYLNKDNEVLSFTKDNLEKIKKYFSIRSLLIPIIHAELAQEVRRCRSKKQAEELELDFNLEKRTKELVDLSNEEINEYIEEHTK